MLLTISKALSIFAFIYLFFYLGEQYTLCFEVLGHGFPRKRTRFTLLMLLSQELITKINYSLILKKDAVGYMVLLRSHSITTLIAFEILVGSMVRHFMGLTGSRGRWYSKWRWFPGIDCVKAIEIAFTSVSTAFNLGSSRVIPGWETFNTICIPHCLGLLCPVIVQESFIAITALDVFNLCLFPWKWYVYTHSHDTESS